MSSRASSLRVVLYARASQVRGPESKSVVDQLATLQRWAQREGWVIVDAHDDGNISASRFANGKRRPGWEATIKLAERGEVDAILTWVFSRNTRDRRVYAELAELCEDTGVKLGYGGRLYDMSNVDDAFMTDLSMALAVRDPKVISKNVKLAAEERAGRGKPHASLGDPWRRVFNPENGKVVGYELDKKRAEIYREAISRVLEGQSLNSVTKDLNSRGLVTASGKPWLPGNLAKGIRRPALAGLRVFHGEVLSDVEAAWPAVIDVETHYRIMALFSSPDRDKYRNSTKVKHLGSGIFRCGRSGCDGRMRIMIRERGTSYMCRDCMKVSRLQSLVDEFVSDVVVKRLSKPDALDALMGPDDSDKYKQARAEVAKLKAQLAEAQQLLKAGDLTPADMAEFRSGWQPRMSAAEEAARPPALPEALVEMASPDAARLWKQASIVKKREVVNALMTVTIMPVGRGGRARLPGFQDVRIKWRKL